MRLRRREKNAEPETSPAPGGEEPTAPDRGALMVEEEPSLAGTATGADVEGGAVGDAARGDRDFGEGERSEGEAPVDDLPDRASGRRSRFGRTFSAPFRSFRSRRGIDDDLLADLEDALLVADVGLPTTTRLIDGLRDAAKAGDPRPPLDVLRAAAIGFFEGDATELRFGEAPSVWVVVGVNGAGKTTTIGKLARREALAGRRVVVAAGDTFRAAAVDQLEIWAERAGVAIVGGGEGADPASVVFDAKQHAAARGADLVIADTAGRLHTKANLMAELEKVRRVADRAPGAVTEVLLVLDATTGQNGLAQARQFTDSVGVTGIVLTKLDGSAKGGVVLAIRSELGLPIKLIGVGEGVEDLVPFDPGEFVDALLGTGE